MYRTCGLILAGVFVAFSSESRRTPIVVSMLSALRGIVTLPLGPMMLSRKG